MSIDVEQEKFPFPDLKFAVQAPTTQTPDTPDASGTKAGTRFATDTDTDTRITPVEIFTGTVEVPSQPVSSHEVQEAADKAVLGLAEELRRVTDTLGKSLKQAAITGAEARDLIDTMPTTVEQAKENPDAFGKSLEGVETMHSLTEERAKQLNKALDLLPTIKKAKSYGIRVAEDTANIAEHRIAARKEDLLRRGSDARQEASRKRYEEKDKALSEAQGQVTLLNIQINGDVIQGASNVCADVRNHEQVVAERQSELDKLTAEINTHRLDLGAAQSVYNKTGQQLDSEKATDGNTPNIDSVKNARHVASLEINKLKEIVEGELSKSEAIKQAIAIATAELNELNELKQLFLTKLSEEIQNHDGTIVSSYRQAIADRAKTMTEAEWRAFVAAPVTQPGESDAPETTESQPFTIATDVGKDDYINAEAAMRLLLSQSHTLSLDELQRTVAIIPVVLGQRLKTIETTRKELHATYIADGEGIRDALANAIAEVARRKTDALNGIRVNAIAANEMASQEEAEARSAITEALQEVHQAKSTSFTLVHDITTHDTRLIETYRVSLVQNAEVKRLQAELAAEENDFTAATIVNDSLIAFIEQAGLTDNYRNVLFTNQEGVPSQLTAIKDGCTNSITEQLAKAQERLAATDHDFKQQLVEQSGRYKRLKDYHDEHIKTGVDVLEEIYQDITEQKEAIEEALTRPQVSPGYAFGKILFDEGESAIKAIKEKARLQGIAQARRQHERDKQAKPSAIIRAMVGQFATRGVKIFDMVGELLGRYGGNEHFNIFEPR